MNMKQINIKDAELIQTLATKRVVERQKSGELNRCDDRSYVEILETFARAQVGHELEVAYNILNVIKELTGEEIIILRKE